MSEQSGKDLSEISIEKLRGLNESLEDRLEWLEDTSASIMERIEDLNVAASASRTNQAKFFFEHNQMMHKIDEVLSTLNRSMDSLSIQMRDISDSVKKKDQQ